MLKGLFVFATLLLLSACVSIERLAIPDKRLLDDGLSQTGTADSISHAAWNQFLDRYTVKGSDGAVVVDYAAVSPGEQQRLKAYVAALSSQDTTPLSKDAQLAYWSNLYNAKTVDTILDHYPVDSIREIKDGFFDLGPWEDKTLTVNGRRLSLHDIEHGIIRPLWNDTPEIHYILNCAAAGCPSLSQQAYTADNIRSLMSQAANAYVNDPRRGVHIDTKGRVKVSKIYLWYREDFGGSTASILDHLRRYATPELQSQLDAAMGIRGYFYDWSLNDAAR